MNTPEETFREEIKELLADLEAALLELEDHPDDTNSVDTAMLAMHTIKSAGGVFGFDKISKFTHHLVNAFDLVRCGDLAVTKDLINIALDSGDHIRGLLDNVDSCPGLDAEGRALMEQFGNLLLLEPAAVAVADKPREKTNHDSQLSATHRIRMVPAAPVISTVFPVNVARRASSSS